ncbi:hypothetical protein AB1Y20_018780 [Prymnesium parvum]|uniref:Sodium/hydrogen exchanger 8 n=1 Tax=Prymnesium parvum TaxID=97485 RepID=A0AB34JTA2_PRYPA
MAELATTLLIGTMCIVAAMAVGDKAVHSLHIWWMTESGATIVVGMVPVVFTLLLLPPIIFDSGYSLNHSMFFSNIGSILIFAFIGTLVAFAITAPVLYFGLGGSTGLLTPMESLAFSALISAVDPVATLAIFTRSGASPKLNALIFGESVLNDAVAIVLFKTVVQLGVTTSIGTQGAAAVTAGQLLGAVGSFCFIFIGSLAIGVLGGAIIALFFKIVAFRTLPEAEAAPAELIVLICMSYTTFLLAEFAKLSGIVASLFSGAIAVMYVQKNLSPAGAKLCKTIVKTLAKFTETIVFLLIGYGFWLYTLGHTSTSVAARHPELIHQGEGNSTVLPNTPCLSPESNQVSPSFIVLTICMCLISRAIATFPLTFIANLFRSKANKIQLNEQCVIWFSGLRGAIALALAVEFPTADEVAVEHSGSFCYQRDHVVSCTIVVVLFTVFVMGGATKPVLKLAGIEMGLTKAKVPLKPTHGRRWKNKLRWLDTNVVRPVLVSQREPAIKSHSFAEDVEGDFPSWEVRE